MDKYLTQSIVRKVLLPTLLFVAALLFFGLCYPHHLHFQEQYQMFLFDVGYMKDIVAVPGGGGKDLDLMVTSGSCTVNAVYYEE